MDENKVTSNESEENVLNDETFVDETEEIEEDEDFGEEEQEFNKPTLIDRFKNYFMPEGVQLEMLRYRPNKLSYMLGLLAVVCLAVGFCVFYSTTSIPDNNSENFFLLGSKSAGPWVGIDVVLNILLMLFSFFAAIRMQSYSLQMGGTSIGIGAWQIIRIFLLPLSLRIEGSMSVSTFIVLVIFYSLSAACSIVAGFLSIYRGKALRRYLSTVAPIENEKVSK